MFATAVSASPDSLIQARSPFRAGYTSACGTGLRGQVFAHFLKRSSVPNGFIREHVSEGTPAYIVDTLGHAGLAESFSVDVANSYVIELFDKARRELVQGIFALVGYLGMDVSRLPLLARPLSCGESFLKLSIVARVRNLLPAGQCGKVLESKINANALVGRSSFGGSYFEHNIQIPITLCILTEIGAVTDFPFWQRTAIKNAKGITLEAKGIPFSLEIDGLKRNPSQASFGASPLKRWKFFGISRFCILKANSGNCSRRKPQLFAGAASKIGEIETGGPTFIPFNSLLLNVVAIIPNKIYRSCLFIKKAIQRFNAVSVGYIHGQILPQRKYPHPLEGTNP